MAKPKSQRTAIAAPQTDEERLRLLIEENRLLAERLEAVAAELAGLRKATAQALQARDAALAEAKAALAAQKEIAAKLGEAAASVVELKATVAKLSAQVKDSRLLVLTSEEASALIRRTVDGLRIQPDLRLGEIDVTLKLAAAKIGTTAVLVLPQPGVETDAGTLHEISFKLTPSG